MPEFWSWSRRIWACNRGWDRPLFLFRAVLWQARRRRGQSFVASLRNDAKISVRPLEAFSGMFYSRWIDEPETLFIRRNAGLAPAFVDVGANVGLFSAQLFDVFERFYLFEAAPSTFAALQATLALNPEVKCVARSVAVGDEPKELSFFDEGDCSSTSRVARGMDAGTIVVHADTLDRLVPAEIGAFVLKVDVEGYEERVFHGAAGHFRAGRPKLVMFERLGRTNLDAVRSFFDDMNYVVFALTDNGDITRAEAAITPPLINLFACPAGDFDRLKAR